MRTFVGELMSFLLPARQTVKFVLNLSFYNKEKISEDQIKAYAGPLADPGNRAALLETARQCIPPNADELVAEYKNISVPTLILWGRHDKVVPLKVGELLSQALPNSVLEVFEECGHVPQEEQPEKTIARISEFLGLQSP
jgi:pimeloyl-ACP methyl ester carboxylesterase